MIPLLNTEFYVKAKSGVEITIPINNKVTIITGDSATGKTKMLNYLSKLLQDKSEIIESKVKLDKVFVCMEAPNLFKVVDKGIENCLVFIDRFDRISDDNKEIYDFITNSSNLFVLCVHKGIPQCGYNLKSILGLKHDGIRYEAKPLFKSQSDFMNNKKYLYK